jgi:hypothetical protein
VLLPTEKEMMAKTGEETIVDDLIVVASLLCQIRETVYLLGRREPVG